MIEIEEVLARFTKLSKELSERDRDRSPDSHDVDLLFWASEDIDHVVSDVRKDASGERHITTGADLVRDLDRVVGPITTHSFRPRAEEDRNRLVLAHEYMRRGIVEIAGCGYSLTEYGEKRLAVEKARIQDVHSSDSGRHAGP